MDDDVESRFNGIKIVTTEQNWLDPDYLWERVKYLENHDIALAYRLMQRVKNIAPTDQNIARLGDLKVKTQKASPRTFAAVSSKQPLVEKRKTNFVKYTESFVGLVKNPKLNNFITPFHLAVTLPFLLFMFYQVIFASERYESRTQLILETPDASSTLDPAMAFLSGIGASSASNDNELLKTYVYSMDMLHYLDASIDLKKHYSNSSIDFFSRLSGQASKEDFLEYFASRVVVDVNAASGVITISAQAFEPVLAQKIAMKISEKSESYINYIGNDLAKSQLRFIQKEHELTEQRLQKAKNGILAFQRQYNLLDPEAEGLALQQITYKLEGEIASKKAQMNALKSTMSKDAPQVILAQAQLNSLQNQLKEERERLTMKSQSGSEKSESGVGELLATYSNLKIELEFALQAYASSQISLEKSRIEAYRQIKYLMKVESPVLPEEAKYPKVGYNLALFLAILLMIFGVGKIIVATVNELR